MQETFKFYLDLPNEGLTEVFPLYESLKFRWTFDQRICDWRKELETDLCFKNITHTTFDSLYTLERECNVCHSVPIVINIVCNNQESEFWRGYLPFRKGEWNIDRCEVIIKPRIDDVYRCILDNWKVERNLLEIENRISVDTLIGTIECQSLGYDQGETQSPPGGHGWTILNLEYERVEDQDGNILDETYFIKWGRECLSFAPPSNSSGWIQEGSNYYRGLIVGAPQHSGNASFGSIDPDDPDFDVTIREFTTYQPIDFKVDNGISLQSAFDYFLSFCGQNVCSDFLSFNSIGNAPQNDEYLCAQNELSNIVIFQASDIIIANATDSNATRFDKTFQEFWEDWKTRLNLYLFWDANNNCIRIEHESFRDQLRWIDLTAKRMECLEGNRKYEYQEEDFPLNEFFKDKIETGSPDFDDASIKYQIECSNDDIDTQDQDYEMKCLITDFASIYNNPDYEEIEILKSMVAIALDSGGTVIQGNGAITGDPTANSPLSWSNVIEKYWLIDRPLSHGTMNDKPRMFKTRPQRKQKDISFKIDCTDLQRFSPNDLLKTQFGWGEWDQTVEYEYPSKQMTGDIVFNCK